MNASEMNAEKLYEELVRRRVELWCQGKMLRFRAPDDALDPEMMTLLRRFKKDLIAILQRESEPQTTCNRLEPTTVGQQALYFLHLSAPYSPAYNVASACRICSPVDVSSVQTAIELLVQRHDSLRTTIEMQSGKLLRRIHESGKTDFATIDVAGQSDEHIAKIVKAEYERPFDLETGPLLRVRWLRRADDDQIMLITLHHIIFDAWSLWILQDELFQLLAQVSGGEIAKLQSPPATFSDFVTEQNGWINSPEGEKDWLYWEDELSGTLPTLDLATDLRRPSRAEFRGATLPFRMPEELSTDLRNLAKTLRLTPFALTLSVFKTLLHRIADQDDVIVGTTTSGRSRSEFNHVIGYFVNSLAIRSNSSDDPLFSDFATEVKAKVLGAIKHQGYPFASIVDRIGRQRSGSGNPIFNVMFGLQKPRFCEAATLLGDDSAEVELAGLRVRPYKMSQQEGQCDLTMELFETEHAFVGTLKYDTDLFTQTTARRLSDQFIHLCGEVVRDPNKRLSQYDLVSDTQRDEIMALSTAEPSPTWDGSLAHEWVSRQASLRPDAVAWVCDSEQQTYEQLDHASDRIAGELAANGVMPGSLVACCFSRCFETASIILGIMKAGAVYVPLDNESPVTRIESLLASCGARTLITDQVELMTSLESSDAIVIPVSRAIDLVSSDSDQADTDSKGVAPADLAYILHTSGSTGSAKGVSVSHEAFARHIVSISEVYQLTADDRVLQFSNLTFDPSLEQMFSAWFAGAMVVARGNELWSPETLWGVVEKHRLTVINLPPAYFQHCGGNMDYDDDLSSLRLMILGGDVFPSESLTAWRSRGVRILNAYGPTEAVVTATTCEVTPGKAVRSATPIGRPRPGSRAYILDSQGRFSPLGTVGRLFLAGPMLADGYYGDEELTSKVFCKDRFDESAKPGVMYDTGDRARWNPDGQLEFLGRVDQQIKVDGIRADTSEVESAINTLPEVMRCCVRLHSEGTAARPGQAELIAWIQPAENESIDAAAENDAALQTRVISHLRSVLPRYMVPRRIVVVESMPLTASGKIAHRNLPRPVKNDRRSAVEFVAPRNEWQSTLAGIWAEELGVPSVGINDNFFDLGGASLTSLRIITRANDAGLNPSDSPMKPELLFEYQSIAELYEHLGAPELTHCSHS
ncbi:non-ribosomal peptide synthetase [Aporhodopirellula aestuarii]|uniref:Amino acid adenylation domain-containing protein n=1 Tax=Aporhodopirellula aestuarii TaxID=2950107 RepID=A0ABT0U9S5_9BACT|nr:amino acid adenylation domain-containing protein [Aporhodopirellula aestuarii]MCM2373285.1 amino acid adenylation domain-containing protein [Aporhodopirellula aestuarii]